MIWKLAAAAVAASLLSVQAQAACTLANGVKHVVYLQFDNTHYLRDNANVPSDLEQMPTLLNFLSGKGMVLENDHTQLISHTANGIITSITGVYPDRSGAGAISNSFNYYNGQTNSPAHTNSSFVYWTNLLAGDNTASGAPNPGADTSYVLVNENGQNAPAPWPAYTKAGCDFGAVGIADMDLENTNTDLANVFGPASAEYAEGTSSSATTRNQAVADFEGIALHCAPGSTVCAAAAQTSASKLSPDVLPQEPGGYAGFQALFGHKYVVPALQQALGQTPTGNLNDLNGNPIGYLTVGSSGGVPTSSVQSGFPGFDGMFPAVTLSYAATMLEAGVPVVYGYFADAHDHHYATADGVNAQGSAFAYGPGEQGYVNQLAQYDLAFKTSSPASKPMGSTRQCCPRLAGFSGTETTVFRYLMPSNSSYMLTQDAATILPVDVGSGAAFDIAAAQSLLWMVQDSSLVRWSHPPESTSWQASAHHQIVVWPSVGQKTSSHRF